MAEPSRRARLSVQIVCALSAVLITACGAETDQDKAAAALQRGIELQQAGRLQSAALQYQTSLLYEPGNKVAYFDLGLTWQLSGRFSDAEVEYRQALAIDPAYTPALFNLALLRTGPAPDEAVQLYRRDLAVHPDDAGARYNLGLLLRSLGQTQAGDAEVAAALRLDPRLARPPAPSPSPVRSPAPSPSGT